ncbi:hypothetical protein SCMU_28690 [Sinomonas cyclohexanicum]|uniref:Zinc finger CGNR domain-containing protein n=1 Tax=Sinomonas cyclohexanicum TaxID=322009 RepID=A0ABM7PXJ6_SINCY|nr:CGNR zinc finger domain-containing protein [Corynebacterium cyclohexanicum]BCT77027.1 hypothetical protein SCMU_28690 [Corynebacterium cyclohexanicum]
MIPTEAGPRAPVRSLFLLFESRVPGLPDGLYHGYQIRRVAEAAGIPLEAPFDLDAYLDGLRAKLYGGGAHDDGDAPPAAPSPSAGVHQTDRPATGSPGGPATQTPWDAVCPDPDDTDVRPVALLRDRLLTALTEPDDARSAELLNAAGRDYDLSPAVDAEGRPRVLWARNDVVSRLAAVLVPAAMSIAAPRQRLRIRRCTDLECRTLFLDRSRDGRGLYCTRRCAARVRGRRRGDGALRE